MNYITSIKAVLVLSVLVLLSFSTRVSSIGMRYKNINNNSRKGMAEIANDTTSIEIEIKDKNIISFYFNDGFYDTEPPYFLSKNDHLKKLNIIHQTLLIDSYHQIPFLIYPGEKLLLQNDKSGLPKFSIDGSEIRNNELRFFLRYYEKYKIGERSNLFIRKNSFRLFDNNYNFSQGILLAKKDLSNRLNFLNDYRMKYKISSRFYIYVHTLFQYIYILDVTRPLSFVNIDLDKLPTQYIRYIDSVAKNNCCDSCLSNEAYRRSSRVIANYISRKYLRSDKRFALSYDTVSTFFTGRTRRFILFVFLKDYMSLNPISYKSKFESFINEGVDEYSEYLTNQQRIIKRFKIESNIKKEISNLSGEKLSWEELLMKFKGNVIYVDFWASWCVPCRKNIPFAHQLQMKLRNKKISFLFISIDDNPSLWEKAMFAEHLDKSSSYLLLDQKKSNLKKRFKIDAIPRYMIINKDGIIVEDNAQFPNSVQIEKILSGYL